MRHDVTHIAVLALMNSCNMPFLACQSSASQGFHSSMDVRDFFAFVSSFFFSNFCTTSL